MGHGVWLSVRFCLSDRDVEGLMTARGGIMTDALVR
jgi:transposase-like protein